MKHRLQLIVFISLSLLAFSFRKDNGNYYNRNFYDKKCSCWVRAWYYPEGQLLSYEQLLDTFTGKREGATLYFSEEGEVIDSTFYKNGKAEGYSFNKNSDGIKLERNYKAGYLLITRLLDSAGTLKEESIYTIEKNPYSGAFYQTTYYSEDGHRIFTEQYKDASKRVSEVFDSTRYTAYLQKLENRTGHELFLANCATCHHPTRDATGPSLKGVTQRHSEKWIKAWVHNSAKMIADGDKEAVSVYYKWHKTAMTAFPDLSEKEMNKLIDYFKSLD